MLYGVCNLFVETFNGFYLLMFYLVPVILDILSNRIYFIYT